MKLDARAERNLQGVHPDLVRVIRRAAAESAVAFTVTEGLRTIERQRQLMRAGASQTLRSRHLTGHAVDLAALVDGKVRWDWPLYERLAAAVKLSAQAEKVPLEWGGDWKTLKDGPHVQLQWAQYPA